MTKWSSSQISVTFHRSWHVRVTILFLPFPPKTANSIRSFVINIIIIIARCRSSEYTRRIRYGVCCWTAYESVFVSPLKLFFSPPSTCIKHTQQVAAGVVVVVVYTVSIVFFTVSPHRAAVYTHTHTALIMTPTRAAETTTTGARPGACVSELIERNACNIIRCRRFVVVVILNWVIIARCTGQIVV